MPNPSGVYENTVLNLDLYEKLENNAIPATWNIWTFKNTQSWYYLCLWLILFLQNLHIYHYSVVTDVSEVHQLEITSYLTCDFENIQNKTSEDAEFSPYQ